MENKEAKQTLSKKGIIILILILAAASLSALLWWRNYERYIVTDDANLDSDRVSLASMVMGRIVNQYVDEGDSVEVGQLLVELDSSAVVAQQNVLFAQQKTIEAELKMISANNAFALKTVEAHKTAYQTAFVNFNQTKIQCKGKNISLDTYQKNKDIYLKAKIALEISQMQVNGFTAERKRTLASANLLNAEIESLRIQLSHYRIIASQKGVIAKRWMLTGDIVQTGQTLYTLDIHKKLWLAIYLEETKYEMISIGKEVKYTLDAYPELTFWGKVYYMGINTASQFSMIPASNASGNFTKVTQRIPIKVSLDSISGDSDLKKRVRLASGMSAEVKIIK